MKLIRSRLTLSVALLTLALTAGCGDVTGLDRESLGGRWDGVGSLYEIAPKLSLFLTNGEDGTFTGSWTQGGSSNEVVDGSYLDGVLRFTLVGFRGESPTFVGTLTNRYRISGTLALDDLDGAAVFRRSSFTVPD